MSSCHRHLVLHSFIIIITIIIITSLCITPSLFHSRLKTNFSTNPSHHSLTHLSNWFYGCREHFGLKSLICFYRATACNATHGKAMSGHPSVERVEYNKTEEICARYLIPHERSFILVFWQEECLVEATPSTWNFGSNWPCWS